MIKKSYLDVIILLILLLNIINAHGILVYKFDEYKDASGAINKLGIHYNSIFSGKGIKLVEGKDSAYALQLSSNDDENKLNSDGNVSSISFEKDLTFATYIKLDRQPSYTALLNKTNSYKSSEYMLVIDNGYIYMAIA